MELTAFRLRVCGVVALGVLALVVVAFAGSVGIFSSESRLSGQAGELAKTVSVLQEQLKEKQAALSVQERRIKELQEIPTLTTVPSRSNASDGPKRSLREPAEPAGDGPLTGLNESREGSGLESRAGTSGRDESVAPVRSRESDTESRLAAALKPEKPSAAVESEESTASAPPPIIEFDAQRLTAALPNAKGDDILSFRLVKDNPDVRFTGYLFVFVEVRDKQGRSQIYAYPEQTRVGEENIPSDYREGQSVAFKYNTRVELPLPSVEAATGSSLAGVSILLYGENGKIVYQRGFERKELKITSAKGNKSDGMGAKESSRRQAL